MTLLRGLPRTLAKALSATLFQPGTLHRASVVRGADQRVTGTGFDPVPVRWVRETLSEAARRAAAIPATDVRILVLAHGLAAEPTTEDEITIDTGRYRIAFVERDPAAATYILRGSPV